MQFAFTDEQRMMRETARRFLDANAPSASMRAAVAGDLGYDPHLWGRLTGEMGWAGTAIPECYGGAGLGNVELGILQHEQGRRLVPSPFFSTVCLAAPLIAAIATEAQKQLWLSRIAAGDVRIAVAVAGRLGATGAAQGMMVELRRSGSSWRAFGMSDFVMFAHACDALLVAARVPDAGNDAGVRLVLIDPTAAGVRIERHVMLDLTRPMSRIRFDNVGIEAENMLGASSAAAADIERAIDQARVALACESAGGAEVCLEMTTDYAKARVQFDRPIGSFQAVKHRLADMMVRVEAAKSASWYAACVADEIPHELAHAAAIAKSACCDAFFQCAADAIQLHGGVGFTWEHDAHLYFKRARAASTLLGSSNWQRERLAVAVGLGESAFTPAY